MHICYIHFLLSCNINAHKLIQINDIGWEMPSKKDANLQIVSPTSCMYLYRSTIFIDM